MERQSASRKEKKRVAYSNHTYITSRKVPTRTVQMQERHQFDLRFSLYLRFWLVKKLPFSGVLLFPEEKQVLATAQRFQQLQAMISEDLQEWSFKIILIKKDIDVSLFNDRLDPAYQACIFSREQVESSLVELAECILFQEQCQYLREKLREQNLAFLRVLKDREEECLEDIYSLLQKNIYFNHSISDISMVDESSVVVEDNNYALESSSISMSDIKELSRSFKTESSDDNINHSYLE